MIVVGVLEKKMSQSTRLGLLGRKVGMMRLFTDEGDSVPVTVVDVSNNRVSQVFKNSVSHQNLLPNMQRVLRCP